MPDLNLTDTDYEDIAAIMEREFVAGPGFESEDELPEPDTDLDAEEDVL